MKCFTLLLCILQINVLFADLHDDLLNQFLKAKEAILFDTVVRDLTAPNSCTQENWNYIQLYVCRCCLVHAVDKVIGTQFDGTKLIEQCKAQGTCTDALIKELKNSENLNAVSDTDFVTILYDRSKIIKHVSTSYDPELKKTGKFTEESLKNFLSQAYKTRKILERSFADPNDLIVTNIKGLSGATTLQLFSVKVKSTGKEFIVKEMGNAKTEIFDLALAAHYKPLQRFVDPNYVKDFPIISLPLAYLEYEAQGRNHYLSVMPMAHGLEFSHIRNEAIKNPTSTNTARLKSAYSALGRTLANFHREFMKSNVGQIDAKSLLGNTIVHADLHVRNIFFDDKTDKIYWIDNERISKSILQPTKIAIDLQYPLLLWLFWDDLLNKIPKDWLETFYPFFLNAYLEAFGGNKLQHAKEMQQMFHTKGYWSQYIDGNLLKILDPILNKIIKETENITSKEKSSQDQTIRQRRRMVQRQSQVHSQKKAKTLVPIKYSQRSDRSRSQNRGRFL